MSWKQNYVRKYYHEQPGYLSGTVEFVQMVKQGTPPGGRVLEVGCGPTNPFSALLAEDAFVWGYDIDPEALDNRDLQDVKLSEGGEVPYDDETFDVCVSNYVLEHVEHIDQHFREIARVLKPGGRYFVRTPNRWHYVGLISSITPHWFHEAVSNRVRGLAPDSHAPYPTFYRCNSRGAFRSTVDRLPVLSIREMRSIEREPSYGMAHPLLFRILMGYERLVNSSPVFAGLRSNLFVDLQKKGA